MERVYPDPWAVFCGRGHTFRWGRIKKREGKGRRKTGKNEKKSEGAEGEWKEGLLKRRKMISCG